MELVPGTPEHLAKSGIVNPSYLPQRKGRFRAIVPVPLPGRTEPIAMGYSYHYDPVIGVPNGYDVYLAAYGFQRLKGIASEPWIEEVLLREKAPFFLKSDERLFVLNNESTGLGLLSLAGKYVVPLINLENDPDLFPALVLPSRRRQ